MTLPDAALDEAVAIVGRTGSGKSYTARGFVERLLGMGRRVCILDPTGVWHGLRSNAAGDGPGFPVAVFGGDHADIPIAESQAEALAKIIAGSNLPSVVDLSGFLTAERRRFCTHFLDTLYHANRGALHLIVDEADEMAPQRPGPDQTTLLNRMDQIVRRGRVKGFRVMMITQRPAVLNKDVLSQAGTLIAMKLTGPQDRAALGAWIDGQADRDKGREIDAGLPRLERGQGWLWWPGGDLLELTKFPAITTYDSSRTPAAGETIMPPTGLAEIDLSAFRAALATPEATIRKSRTVEPMVDIEAIRAQAFLEGVVQGRRDVIEAMKAPLKALVDVGGLGDVIDVDRPAVPMRIAAPVYSGPGIDSVVKSAKSSAIKRDEAKGGPKSGLHGAATKMLETLARHRHSMTWIQLATLSGLKASGGHFNAGRKQMRESRFIVEAEDRVALTAIGRTTYSYIEQAPISPSELLDVWCARLPSPAPDMLRALAACEKPIDVTTLARSLKKQPSGGHWNSGIAVLRNNGLIHQDGTGALSKVQISDLFRR